MRINLATRRRLYPRAARTIVTTVLACTAMALGILVVPSPATAAETTIAREYYHKNWRGDVLRVYVNFSFRCSSSKTYYEVGVRDLSDHFNDDISSFRTYVGCRAKHFQNNDYLGVRTDWQTTQSYIGDAMNDRTSSLQYT